VDSDTIVSPNSLKEMVSKMVLSPDVIAVTGETKVANESQNIITKIQAYDYFLHFNIVKSTNFFHIITHNSIADFQSAFGMVLCLPGCFSCFQTKYLVHRSVLQHLSKAPQADSIIENNLLRMGEDRYLFVHTQTFITYY
jgi:cellulose synthase/poly-beta-1,6-N-acetylglucosamine synthase-like glycosyltransferase